MDLLGIVKHRNLARMRTVTFLEYTSNIVNDDGKDK